MTATRPPGTELASALSLCPPGRPASRAVAVLTLLALLVAITVSSSLLTALGIPYAAPTGSFVYKLHPATLLIGLALVLALAGNGNPLRELGRSLAHQPAVAVYLGTVLAMAGWSVLRFGLSGAAFFIDTLMMPAVLLLLLARLDLDQQRRLFVAVAGLLVLNALIGIAEQLLRVRLEPYTVGEGIVLVEDVFRATALFGHPLTNAALTGFLLFVLYRLRDPAARLALCLVATAALLSFGGRTALMVNLALLVMLATLDLARHARDEGLTYRQLTGGTLLIFLMLATLVAAVAMGSIGQRIATSLVWDQSAQVREKSLLVFGHLGWQPLVFGMSPEQIAEAAWNVGIRPPDAAIESFWLVLALQVGIPLTALFGLGLAGFFARLARLGGAAVGLGLLGFVLVTSTSISLAFKSELLVVVAALAHLAAVHRCSGRASLEGGQLALLASPRLHPIPTGSPSEQGMAR